MDDKEKISEGEVKIKSPILSWLDNFWYHYKWHTIVACFLIVTITILSLQTCSKTSYDLHVIYAGPKEISRSSSDGGSEYVEMTKSLGRVVDDFDGDGEVNVNLLNLFVVNEEEKAALLKDKPQYEINEALVIEDTNTLKTTIVYGEHYLCFLSERLFKEYEATFNGAIFDSLDGFSQNGELEYASEEKTGVYLRSLAIKELPVLENLPEDTVVCVRALSEVSSVFDKAENEENHRRAIETVKNIFEYK